MITKKDTAIVIGYKGPNSTGLIRSLGEGGYDVVFASSYSKIESKHTTGYWYLPEEEEARIAALCEHLRKLPSKAALFTGDDASVQFIERHYDRLSPYCYCPTANGKLRQIADKSVMAKIAAEVGLRAPRTAVLDLQGQVESPIALPVILKPYAGLAGSKSDIRICRTEEEFRAAVDYLRQNGYTRILVQQLLDGDDLQDICAMGFSLPDGTVKIPCAIRKIRSYPLKQGSLSFGRVDEGALGDTKGPLEAFVRRTGYIGIFDIDMMISDGVPYFIEINYRNGQNGYVSTAAGYNIPANWFRGMQGEAMDEDGPLQPLYYMDERSDYRHIKEGAVSFKRWTQEFRMASVFAMYHRHDLRPFIRQYLRFPERWKIKRDRRAQ